MLENFCLVHFYIFSNGSALNTYPNLIVFALRYRTYVIKGAKKSQVDKIYCHSGFSPTGAHDIAVVTLKTPISFQVAGSPLELADKPFKKLPLVFKIIGWGAVECTNCVKNSHMIALSNQFL